MKHLITLLLTVTFGLCSMAAFSQSITGKWKTIDDETGKPKSIVHIYEQGGKYYGKILKLFRGPDEDPDPVCEECEGSRKNKKIVGMVIVNDMVQDEDEYEDGTIIDPANGNEYRCKMWLEDGKLMVRGYIAFLYRTQTWLPVSN